MLAQGGRPRERGNPTADPPAVLPPPIAGRAAISPATQNVPGDIVAALQDSNHEAVRGALSNSGRNAKDLDEPAYYPGKGVVANGVTER